MYPDIYGSNVYNPYNNPMIQPPQPQPMERHVDKVNGKNGADMFRMAPNSDALLIDENNPIVWFVKTDSAGYKTVIPYDITPHADEPSPDVKGIDERLNSIDERLKALEEALK